MFRLEAHIAVGVAEAAEKLIMRVPGWVEREEREPVSLDASIVLPDGRSVPVMIRDVSASGCCVECDEALPIAQTVQLGLGDDSFEAEVRWALPGAAGLHLTSQIGQGRWFARPS